MRPAVVAVLLSMPLAIAADDKPTTVKLGKLSAPTPASWKAEKPNNRLRSYQFKISGEGQPDAELVVMPESNPKAEKVFPRWKGGFVPPDGKTVDDISKVSKLEGVKGATIELLDVAGTWKHKERPFDPTSKEELLENYRVIWAIVYDGNEAEHIRFSGPKPTVDKHYSEFETWLKSLK